MNRVSGLAPAVVEAMYATLGRLRQEGLTLLLAEQAVELALEVADYGYVLQTGLYRAGRASGGACGRRRGAAHLSRPGQRRLTGCAARPRVLRWPA